MTFNAGVPQGATFGFEEMGDKLGQLIGGAVLGAKDRVKDYLKDRKERQKNGQARRCDKALSCEQSATGPSYRQTLGSLLQERNLSPNEEKTSLHTSYLNIAPS